MVSMVYTSLFFCFDTSQHVNQASVVSTANNLDTSSNFVNTLAAELVVNGVSSVMAEEMVAVVGNWRYPLI